MYLLTLKALIQRTNMQTLDARNGNCGNWVTPEVVRKEHFYLFDAEGVKFPLTYFCQTWKKQKNKNKKLV